MNHQIFFIPKWKIKTVLFFLLNPRNMSLTRFLFSKILLSRLRTLDRFLLAICGMLHEPWRGKSFPEEDLSLESSSPSLSPPSVWTITHRIIPLLFGMNTFKVTQWLKKDILLFDYDNGNEKKYIKFDQFCFTLFLYIRV